MLFLHRNTNWKNPFFSTPRASFTNCIPVNIPQSMLLKSFQVSVWSLHCQLPKIFLKFKLELALIIFPKLFQILPIFCFSNFCLEVFNYFQSKLISLRFKVKASSLLIGVSIHCCFNPKKSSPHFKRKLHLLI